MIDPRDEGISLSVDKRTKWDGHLPVNFIFPQHIQYNGYRFIMTISWKQKAQAKRQATLDAIPQKWKLSAPIPPATEMRDITGAFIQQFLTAREIEITETDAVEITEYTTTGKWSAVEVTEAFCHRAALAHQMVYIL